MPGEPAPTWLGPAWQWSILVLAFVACVAGAYGRGAGMRMLAPIAAVAAVHLAMMAAIVPQQHIRAGYLLLFAAADVALVVGAVVWMRSGRRSVASFEPRGSWLVWMVAWLAGLAWQLSGVLRVSDPIDVAIASDIGARLMQGGVPVYGNLVSVAGLLRHGDTYGPISYLAYVPGVGLIGDGSILWSNFGMSLIVSVLMLVAGLRGGSLRRGAWAAATWSTCPFVALGVVAGNNDVVVALAISLVLFTARRPAWRGSMVAVAACTKFVPAIIGVVLWRLRGEDRRATLRYVLGGLVTLFVILAVALRGTDALDEFWTRAIVFQLDRDDLASFWGMSQLSQLRYVVVAAAVIVAVVAARRMPNRDIDAGAAACAAVLALVLAGLPQYWGTYVTWIVPAVLVAMLWRDVSAGRCAGALPSSTDPS
jgi:hypothetical protein